MDSNGAGSFISRREQHNDVPQFSSCFQTTLISNVQRGSETVYIDDPATFVLESEALDPERSTALTQLENHLWRCYKHLGGVDGLTKHGHGPRPRRSSASLSRSSRQIDISQQSCSLLDDRLGGTEDVVGVIAFEQDALALRPSDHPDRSASLSNLAHYLSAHTKDSHPGGSDDLDDLALCPPVNPDRLRSLTRLAIHLCIRYGRPGGIDVLNEAIVSNRNALVLRQPGHPGRSTSLFALTSLCDRYKPLKIDDLDETIALSRDAVVL